MPQVELMEQTLVLNGVPDHECANVGQSSVQGSVEWIVNFVSGGVPLTLQVLPSDSIAMHTRELMLRAGTDFKLLCNGTVVNPDQQFEQFVVSKSLPAFYCIAQRPAGQRPFLIS